MKVMKDIMNVNTFQLGTESQYPKEVGLVLVSEIVTDKDLFENMSQYPKEVGLVLGNLLRR